MIEGDSQFFVEVLRSGLQDRVIVASNTPKTRVWHVIYLQSGSIDVVAPDSGESQRLDGPLLICLAVRAGRSVRLVAGSTGAQMTVDRFGMSAALGTKPEAAELRLMIEDLAVLSLSDLDDVNRTLAQSFSVILRELGGALAGRETIVEAQLRYLLVLLWRHSYRTQDGPATDGPQTVLLRRFRQLVETHFRSRWRVSDYASELGTTPDRLHNLTTKILGRSPSVLIHERCLHEAKVLLDRSNMTLEQVGEFLGFNSASQFNQFFKTREGLSPGKYRTTLRTARKTDQAPRVERLMDWP